MFKNYLASNEEGRLGSQLYYDKKIGWTWDASLGGHVGIIRYGTQDPAWPEGWQFDVDGAALPRLDSTRSMVSTDFRIGFPLTHREGPWEFKFGYYHLSSHLGDLYIESHPGIMRLNYVREQLVFGVAYRPICDLRFYGEANWAFREDGGSQPWEFQFGIDYSPAQPNGFYGAPFRGHQLQDRGGLELQRQLDLRSRLAMARAHRPYAPHGPRVLRRLQFSAAVLQRLPAVPRGRGVVRFLTITAASPAVGPP